MAPTTIPIFPVALAAFLGAHGLRKRSLSPSGALAAFVVGSTICAIPLRTLPVSLILFYLIASRATKVGYARKRTLEEAHEEAGYRTAWQVFCNSLSALIAGLLWSASFVPPDRDVFSALTSFLGRATGLVPTTVKVYDSAEWCPLDRSVAGGWSRILVFITLGHYACCLGDTLASELGILSQSYPILITTFKRVPPGTNGGLSTIGTMASISGGSIMGIIASITLYIENSACRSDAFSAVILPLLGWGTFAGLFGSLLDSFLGATLQATRYSKNSKHILKDDSLHARDVDVEVVSGIAVLNNNQVNLISSIATAVLLGLIAA